MRKELIRRIEEAQLLKLLGLKEDDVILEFSRCRVLGINNWSGWTITFSTIIEEETKKEETK